MLQIEKLSEKELIERILGGEKPLYEIIVRRFNPYLYKIGRSYNYNHEDTQDLMQDSFVDAYKNLAKFEGRSAFKTWMIRIMMNNCFQKRRKASFENEIPQEVENNARPMFGNTDNDPEKTVQNRELGHIIEEALCRIPFDYRMVFSLREVNGMNTAETAELMEITETNVKARLSRAKAMLRKEIEKNYAPQELFEFNLIYCDCIVENVMERINDY